MSIYVPEELLVKILSLQPPKSLIRFRSVCKTWDSLIGNPDFFSKNLLNHSIIISPENPDDHRFLVVDGRDKFTGARQGPWNFSDCKSPTGSIIKVENVGFGLDLKSNDLKVVRIRTYLRMPGKGKPVQDVQLYSVNRGSWTELCVDLPYGFLDRKRFTFYIDGVFYWYAPSDCDFVLKNEIVAFDMSEDTFSMTKVPDKCCVESNNYWRWTTLTELKKRVAMIRYTSESSNITFHLWVLLEFGVMESWTKLFTIIPASPLGRPLGLWKNGKFFLTDTMGHLVLWDPLTGEIKKLNVAEQTIFSLSIHSMWKR
ncbi:putative F-box protein At4g09190 [Quercus robur]|uniref:putative F-box protein At4g09190 n=1 Tax=Quercus robur TaxID=38942 RepID=UPI002163E66E|nr:putative F-box protein At4g09190 [Quercus robur]